MLNIYFVIIVMLSYLNFGKLLVFKRYISIAKRSTLLRSIPTSNIPAGIELSKKYLDLNYKSFFQQRNWSVVENYWASTIRNSSSSSSSTVSLPIFVRGYNDISPYGVTDLQAIEDVGKLSEFKSKDTIYTDRWTYALRIGYVGSYYYGYQTQNKVTDDLITVEDDIYKIIKRIPNSAGRTDRGVSAVSQIICFASKSLVDPKAVLANFTQSEATQAGKLVAYDCVRVPRKFNARSRAIWRRYLYLFPLNHDHEVDVAFINDAFQRITGVDLNYNAFCRGVQRNVGDGMQDICHIYFVKCYPVKLDTLNSSSENSTSALCFEIVGNRFLRNMVRILVSTLLRESLLPGKDREVNVLLNACNNGRRYDTESPIAAEGLCLAGVGFDLEDLALYRNMPRSRREVLGVKDICL